MQTVAAGTGADLRGDLDPAAYGAGRGEGADAIKEVHALLAGLHRVLAPICSKYFDTIPHQD
jgi:hypothetical protein